MRARLCIHPSARSWRMPASTSGYPVIPSFHAASPSGSSSQRSPRGRMSSTWVRGRATEDLGVEVAPAELADERLSAPLRGAHGKRPRRDAAEVQVGREPRGRVGRDRIVAARAVSVEMLPKPSSGALDAGPLTAGHALVLIQHKVRPRPARCRRAAGSPAASGPASPTAPPTTHGGRARTPGSGRCPSEQPRPRERRSWHRRGGGRAPAASLRCRSTAYGLTSALAKTVVAPIDRAARTVSATTSPRRTSSAPPSRRSDASRSASDSGRNARRPAAAPKRVVPIPSSSTNSGNTVSAASTAAASVGLSWTRRSRVKRTTATCTAVCPRS